MTDEQKDARIAQLEEALRQIVALTTDGKRNGGIVPIRCIAADALAGEQQAKAEPAGDYYEAWEEGFKAAKAQLTAQPAAPTPDMVMVPREPTMAMMIAGDDARLQYCLNSGDGLVHDPLTEVSEVYRAMIAAAGESNG